MSAIWLSDCEIAASHRASMASFCANCASSDSCTRMARTSPFFTRSPSSTFSSSTRKPSTSGATRISSRGTREPETVTISVKSACVALMIDTAGGSAASCLGSAWFSSARLSPLQEGMSCGARWGTTNMPPPAMTPSTTSNNEKSLHGFGSASLSFSVRFRFRLDVEQLAYERHDGRDERPGRRRSDRVRGA